MFIHYVLKEYWSGEQLADAIRVPHTPIHMMKYLYRNTFRMGWVFTVGEGEASLWKQELTDIWHRKQ